MVPSLHAKGPLFVSAVNYKVVIKTGKEVGGGRGAANDYCSLPGDLNNTRVMNLPKNEKENEFRSPELRIECRSVTSSVCKLFHSQIAGTTESEDRVV